MTDNLKKLGQDKSLLVAFLCLIVVSLAVSVYTVVQINSSELKVVTHYTDFGNTFFYRDNWFYLFSFAILGIVNAVLYPVLAYKISKYRSVQLAKAFLWVGVLVAIILFFVVSRVLRVAALS